MSSIHMSSLSLAELLITHFSNQLLIPPSVALILSSLTSVPSMLTCSSRPDLLSRCLMYMNIPEAINAPMTIPPNSDTIAATAVLAP